KKTETEDIDYYKFKLDEVKSKLGAVVTYTLTKPFEFHHPNVPMDIQLKGLDELPKIEVEEPENPEEDGKDESGDTESGEGNDSDENETEKPEEEKPEP